MKRKLSAKDIKALQKYPIRLPIVRFASKDYTIDPRLKEFRFIKFGEKMEFIPFDSIKGQKILKKIKKVI